MSQTLVAAGTPDDGGPLSDAERAELRELTAVVHRHQQGFMEVADALLQIRDKRLWRASSPSFEAFVDKEFGFGRRRSEQIIGAAAVVKAFAAPPAGAKGRGEGGGESGGATESDANHGSHSSRPENAKPCPPPLPAPKNERQARELAKVPEEQREQVWAQVVESAPKGEDGSPKISAAHVKQVVEGVVGRQGPKADDPAKPGEATPLAPLYDAALLLVPAHLLPVFHAAKLFDKALEHFRQIAAATNEIADGPAAAHLAVAVSFARDLENARQAVKFARPHAVCPHCKGTGKDGGCSPGNGCRGLGWMTEAQYRNVPAEFKRPRGGRAA